jgi:hypothetical protein
MQEFRPFKEFPELKPPLPREAGDGICLEVKPKGLHERRKYSRRYTVERGWERRVAGGWEQDK